MLLPEGDVWIFPFTGWVLWAWLVVLNRKRNWFTINAILHYNIFARAGGANLWEHKTFRALWRSRTRHGSRNVFYFHGVPTSAKAYGKSYACVFFRMLLQVLSARAGETGVMENRLKTIFATIKRDFSLPLKDVKEEISYKCFTL